MTSYQPKTYRKQGGDEFVVASGGKITVESGGVVERSEQILCTLGAKVGGTAGWTVGAAADRSGHQLPASQTASTLVIPVQGLKVGDIITAFSIVGQIESAGGTATLDAALRKLTVAAADLADALVAAMTQVSVTADTALSAANAAKTGLTETVGADEGFYMLLTGTTAAATDVDLIGVLITVTRQ